MEVDNHVDLSAISEPAKDFITKLLKVEPEARMTASQALDHPWLQAGKEHPEFDLLPHVRKGFNAIKMFRKAVGVVKAINSFSRSPSMQRMQKSNTDLDEQSSNQSLDDGKSLTGFARTVETASNSSLGLLDETSPNLDAPQTNE